MTAEEEETLRKYGDIIGLPHPVSKTHPGMTASQRAAQFAPFAALTGFDDELAETARYTEERRTLDENRREELDQRLQELQLALDRRDSAHGAGDNGSVTAQITYFSPDEKKEGGAYRTIRGAVKRIDRYLQAIIMDDGTEIPAADIYGLSISAADNYGLSISADTPE